MGWHFALNKVAQLQGLAQAARAHQAQMHHNDVYQHALHVDDGMQQAALLKAVVRNVLVLVLHHGPAREQGIAMFAVRGNGVADVDRMVAIGCKVVSLRLAWPVGKNALGLPIELAHFLQANDIGLQIGNGLLQVVYLKPPQRPHALHPFVDVVSDYPQVLQRLCLDKRHCSCVRFGRYNRRGWHSGCFDTALMLLKGLLLTAP